MSAAKTAAPALADIPGPSARNIAVRVIPGAEKALREKPPADQTTGYRLVHGENDGLPGFVVDRYEGTLVIKLYTAAWIPHLPDVVAALTHAVAVGRLVLRLGRAVRERPGDLHGLEACHPGVALPTLRCRP